MSTATSASTDLSGNDLYGVLGVDASAGGDEIARAFRTRAKTLHPDTSADPDAAAKFNTLVGAYGVLSNHRTRREYDAGRARRAHLPASGAEPSAGVGTAGGVVGANARSSKPTRWTRRRAWTAVVGGALVFVLGIGAAVLTWHLHDSDARTRAKYRPVTAIRLGTTGDIAFVTAAGHPVETREPQQHGEGSDTGPTVKVRYDPADPTRVIVDASTVGRDITLALVSLKLLIGGPVFVVLGARHLRRRNGPRGRRATGAR